MADVAAQEGTVEFRVPSIETPCHTYYKIFGKIGSRGPPPLIILHGGPGAGHEYCLPLRKLWPVYGIPVVFYDQIGCAASTLLPQTLGDQSFWTFDLFVAELKNLLEHLGINATDGPGYHILGHSWGGRLAADFASRQPPGLQRLILFSTAASGQLFSEGLLKLKKQVSLEAQQAIDEAIRTREFTNPAYLAAQSEFSKMFLCRADPWPPEELAMSFKHGAADSTVRLTLQGPSPWLYEGILKDYSSIPLLPKIMAPTMIMNGEFDTTQYESSLPLFEHIPRVRWVTIATASHMPFLDSADLQGKTLRLIGDFLGHKSKEWE